jgi:hypothetical protein
MTKSSLISATVSRARLLCLFLGALGAAVPAHGAAPPTLPELLDHVGRQVQQFWSDFSSVTCTETVMQSKLGDKDKVLSVQRQTFDYLISMQASGTDISVDESRLEKVSTHSKAKASLLETNGFGIFSLLFHPLYQSRFQFRQLPDETLRDHRLIVVSFQQVTRDHPLSVLRLRELEYPLQWRGKAWIDPASWAVLRIQAGLGDSMADVGLLRLDADVTYSDVRFNGSTVYWLPVTAIIDAETKRQRWHNTHMFTSYKRFSVDTDSRILTTQ